MTIVSSAGDTVATLVRDRPVAGYKQVSLRWNGREGLARGYSLSHSPNGTPILTAVNTGTARARGRIPRSRGAARAAPTAALSAQLSAAGGMTAVLGAPLAATLPSAGVIAAALAGALVVIGLLSALLVARPDALPLLAIAALPFRLPISAQGRTVNLLIPLYLVVGAAIVAHVWRRVSPPAGDAREADAGAMRADAGPGAGLPLSAWRGWLSARGLRWLLLGAVALYVLQAAYSDDHAKAAENSRSSTSRSRCSSWRSARCASRRAWCSRASAWRSGWRSCSPASASSSTTASRCS